MRATGFTCMRCGEEVFVSRYAIGATTLCQECTRIAEEEEEHPSIWDERDLPEFILGEAPNEMPIL